MRKVMVAMMAIMLALGACTSIDCPLNHTVYTTYKLYLPDGTPDTIGTDSLWIITKRANRTDSFVVNALTGTSATYFNLPVSYMQPEDTFYAILTCPDGDAYLDTFYVKKNNFPHFESVDCQASYFHEITSVRWTDDLIDSIVIINPYANYDKETEHFHIYLNPSR